MGASGPVELKGGRDGTEDFLRDSGEVTVLDRGGAVDADAGEGGDFFSVGHVLAVGGTRGGRMSCRHPAGSCEGKEHSMRKAVVHRAVRS